MTPKVKSLVCAVVFLSVLLCGFSIAANTSVSRTRTESQQILDQKESADQLAVAKEAKIVADAAKAARNLPHDNTPRYTISRIEISGNTLISSADLLKRLPEIYSASPVGKSAYESAFLYDFRGIKQLIENTSVSHEISARTIQGLTQYLLSKYQQKGYSGVYVYISSDAFKSGKELSQGILPIRVLEATVSDVTNDYYDVNNKPAEKEYLNSDALMSWSPVKSGKVARKKDIDDYVNLLNQNPDRYVTAVISRGDDANSLSVEYRVYEANPWHFFVQADNSGTKDVQWAPRFGLVNTNLLGFDDKLTVVYQTPINSSMGDQYAVYGSYDFPIWGPRLRLNIFGGYNEFDIAGNEGIDFLGNGSFAGATLRYNLFQFDKWFFDATGTIVYEQSKVTSSLASMFPEIQEVQGTNIHTTLWGYGFGLYKTEDMAETSLGFNWLTTLDSSSQREITLTRSGAKKDFSITTLSARHSRYLDRDKVQRLTVTAQWIIPNERVVPSRMTSFGGMYSVRGYDEYEVIADGGILASLQYEYDLVRADSVTRYATQTEAEKGKYFLRKLSPLVFLDYGRATIEDAQGSEDRNTEMCSLGAGLITEIGKNFTGTVYYGYPLIATNETHTGKGRLNAGVTLRW
jgi:hemolysin activation/secretion protein